MPYPPQATATGKSTYYFSGGSGAIDGGPTHGNFILNGGTSSAGIQFPMAGTFKNLYIRGNVVTTGTNQSMQVTFRKNGATTTLTATLPSGTTGPFQAQDITHTVSVAVGDVLDVLATNRSINIAQSVGWILEFDPA